MSDASSRWRVAETTEFDPYDTFYVEAVGGRLVATVWSGVHPKTNNVAYMRAMAEANARLIAAAPDLLEIVRDVVSDGKGYMNPSLYDLAVKALARATSA